MTKINWTELRLNRATIPICFHSGAWSDWTPWSSCSKTCDRGGISHRRRHCSNPHPRNGGKDCPALDPDYDEKSCFSHPCPGKMAETEVWIGLITLIYRLKVKRRFGQSFSDLYMYVYIYIIESSASYSLLYRPTFFDEITWYLDVGLFDVFVSYWCIMYIFSL